MYVININDVNFTLHLLCIRKLLLREVRSFIDWKYNFAKTRTTACITREELKFRLEQNILMCM
jgi:hypothetical protein